MFTVSVRGIPDNFRIIASQRSAVPGADRDARVTQGNAEAQKHLASLTKEMTPQQVVEAREKAQKCKSSGYEQCE